MSFSLYEIMITPQYLPHSLQEKWKRENLRHTLELKSSDHDEQVQRAFATALDMQQKSEEEAAALKAELGRTERKRQKDIDTLAQQVGINMYARRFGWCVILITSRRKS